MIQAYIMRDIAHLRQIATDLQATAPAQQPVITLSLIHDAVATVERLTVALAAELERVLPVKP